MTPLLGTVTNFGTIGASGTGGTGVDLAIGGSLTNGSPGSSISGTLYGAYLGGGYVDNNGIILSNGSSGAGIRVHGSATIINGNSTSLIDGSSGITVGVTGTITNDGAILGAVGGVATGGGGTIGNYGTILGANYGVYMTGINDSVIGTVSNYGSIGATSATGTGIELAIGGTVTNGSTFFTGASITGGVFEVLIGIVSGSVYNYGDIEGLIAVQIQGADGKWLIPAPSRGRYLASTLGLVACSTIATPP